MVHVDIWQNSAKAYPQKQTVPAISAGNEMLRTVYKDHDQSSNLPTTTNGICDQSCFFLTGVSSLMSKMLFGLFHYEDFNRLKLASLIGMVILTIIVAITLLYMWYKNQKEEMRAWRRRRAARYTPALIDMYPLYGIPPPPYSKDCTPIRKPNHIAIYPAFMVRGRKELRRKDLKISPVKNSKIKDNATPKRDYGANN
ncbi:hypothetical protein T11_18313 [Trichinella zimbabwensis]|uniref:Uncharacterized protein n=1 Tax=Trichinella zimbabwensis TaxID=268475 RepID=A0A0V1GT60_9BILA|nr:hypothetical protein T11_12655 [Trichinella zimbabwensis]KRZ01496.1 hypothetical protein T11_18313 [Trichinella zimbabwensis]